MSDFKFPGAPKGYVMSKEKPSIEMTARKTYYPKMSAPKVPKGKPPSLRVHKSPPMEVKVVGFSKGARALSKARRLRS